MASFAVLGEWGIGKSSLLLKLADCCRGAHPPMLPVHLSISQDMGDYLRFAESLCDKLADALAASDSLTTRLRTEVRNWKLKRVNAGPLTVERDSQRFLTSGSALLRHVLTDAWLNSFARRGSLGQCSSWTTCTILRSRPGMLLGWIRTLCVGM